MHAVRSLGRRLDKEEESLTQLPEAEWAILPKWEPGMDFPAGKVALDFFLPELQAGDILLAQNIRLKMTGPEHVALVGPQWLREKHTAPSNMGLPSAAKGYPSLLYAPELR